MRVLVLNANLRERGTYFRARHVARGLYHRGHDVTFVCQGEGWYRPRIRARRDRWFEWETGSWTPHRMEEGHSPLAILQRIARLYGSWDLIYTFSHMPVDVAPALALRRGHTFWMTDWCDLWSSRQGGLHDWRHWAKPLPPFMEGLKGVYTKASYRAEDTLEAWTARNADAVSIIATPMLAYTRRLGMDDDRVLHLISGADTGRIRPLDKAECRRTLGLDPAGEYVGYVANYTPDNDQLTEALSTVWRERPALRVLSVGPRWYTDKGLIADAVAAGRLIDYGRRPFAEVPTYLGASDFLLMPIRDLPVNQCRWPNKFSDYLSSGRATATTRVGDMARVVERWNVGAINPPTAAGLAQSILTLAENPSAAQEMGTNARRVAEDVFSWKSRITRLCHFLRHHGVG